jgi:hypothetical protein
MAKKEEYWQWLTTFTTTASGEPAMNQELQNNFRSSPESVGRPVFMAARTTG